MSPTPGHNAPGRDLLLRELYEQRGGDLLRVALALTGHRADAEDLVQETFLLAYEQFHRFEGRSSLYTWMRRILWNRALNGRRARRLRSADSITAGELEPPSQNEPIPDQVVHRIDALAMLQTLSEGHRQVLILRELEGLSYQEIADELAIPRGTVESRLFRARRELLQRFPQYLGEQLPVP